MEISKNINKFRINRKMTLKDLSDKTELSVSFLSQVERGNTSLAITSLKKIADALKVPVKDFFEDSFNNSYLVNKENQKPFRIEGSIAEYIRLGGDFAGRELEPMLVTLDQGQRQDKVFNHPGEEFYYVLKGIVIFNVEGKDYVVREGESIHFPSEKPHYWENLSTNKTQMLSVLNPTIF